MTTNKFPAALQRRSFLKGAAVVLTAPPVALGGDLAPRDDELQQLIDRCDELLALGNESELILYQFFHRADRPTEGYVTGKEFGAEFWPSPKNRHSVRSDIDRIVDHRIDLLRLNAVEFGNRTFDLGKKVVELNAHRSRLHGLFDERQAIYDAWDVSSGNRDANARTAAIWKEFFEFQDQIFEFPCTNIDQLSRKAAYLAREWGSDLPPERQVAFLEEVAAFATKVGAA